MKSTSPVSLRLLLGILILSGVGQISSVYAGVRISIGLPLPIIITPRSEAVYDSPQRTPGLNAVWIPGQNEWNGYQWVWYPGHYAYQPYPDGIWLGGYWGNSGGHRSWVHSHWDHQNHQDHQDHHSYGGGSNGHYH